MISQWTLAIARRIPISRAGGTDRTVSHPVRGRQARGRVVLRTQLFSKRTKTLVRFLGWLSRSENSRTLRRWPMNQPGAWRWRCQGGGAHGAFTWGVLDQLLEDGLTPDAICGVSSGAIIGTMLAQGLAREAAGGRATESEILARGELRRTRPSVQSGRWNGWLWGWDMSDSVLWRGLEIDDTAC